ncbi:MAG: GNAT family N-acetyltransferase [Chloroflexia bacterium]|nr:GNAT family N-acetyltransferase [Chloroflexia bacterium]
MSEYSIRRYRPTDEAGLIRTWNGGLYADQINATTWRAKVLLDPNFDRDGCLVAEVDGEVRGFILCLVRRVPFFNQGLDPDKSWITAFAVDPAWQRQGIGRVLLEAATERLRGMQRTSVALAPYVPNYFTPGADVTAYAHGIDFLTRQGFEAIERPISMRAELTGFETPAPVAERQKKLDAEGVEIRPVSPDDITRILDFIPRHFSWDWHREASGVFNDLYNGDPRFVGLIIALQGEDVLGYAQHRGERFGPFGVRPDLRSRGIGRVLLSTTLSEMLKKNFHAAWFLWTGDDAARLYSQLGFHQVRRFAVLQRVIR